MSLFIFAFIITLVAHWCGRWLNKFTPNIPAVLYAMSLLSLMLVLLNWSYVSYAKQTQWLFNHLLGYAVVGLAFPIASIRFNEFRLRELLPFLIFSSLFGALFPMILAWLFHLPMETILSFATRSVTSPIAINIAGSIEASVIQAGAIVIISGLIGVALVSPLCRHITDDRARGLSLGLAAHAIGTAYAFEQSPTMGKYAAFGMAINGLITVIWLPIGFKLIFG